MIQLSALLFWRSFSPCWDRPHFFVEGGSCGRADGSSWCQKWRCHLTNCFQHSHFHGSCLLRPRPTSPIRRSMTRSTAFPSLCFFFFLLLFIYLDPAVPLPRGQGCLLCHGSPRAWCPSLAVPPVLSSSPKTKPRLVLRSCRGASAGWGEEERESSSLGRVQRSSDLLGWRFSPCRIAGE